MLNLKPEKQKPGFCGPASLKMVLEYYGIKKNQEELGRLCHATKEKGASPSSLSKTAKKFGLKGFIKEYSSLREIKKYVLKKKIPVIVDWFSVDESHYSVVVHIDKKYIYLRDPEYRKVRKIKLDKFERTWFGFDIAYTKPLSKLKDISIRRIIVLYK